MSLPRMILDRNCWDTVAVAGGTNRRPRGAAGTAVCRLYVGNTEEAGAGGIVGPAAEANAGWRVEKGRQPRGGRGEGKCLKAPKWKETRFGYFARFRQHPDDEIYP